MASVFFTCFSAALSPPLSLSLSSGAPQKSTRGNKIWLSMHLNFLMWQTHPSVRSPFLLAYVKCHNYCSLGVQSIHVYILYLKLDLRIMFNWQLPKQYCMSLSQAQVFNKLRLCVLGRYLMYGHIHQGCHSSKRQNSLTFPWLFTDPALLMRNNRWLHSL